jgi:hypothetical protein
MTKPKTDKDSDLIRVHLSFRRSKHPAVAAWHDKNRDRLSEAFRQLVEGANEEALIVQVAQRVLEISRRGQTPLPVVLPDEVETPTAPRVTREPKTPEETKDNAVKTARRFIKNGSPPSS